MVFGDNVRARRAARALPRTPTQEEEEDREKREDKRQDPAAIHNHNTMRQDKTCTVITRYRDTHHNTDDV